MEEEMAYETEHVRSDALRPLRFYDMCTIGLLGVAVGFLIAALLLF
jgi:hypothetical protein